MCQFNQITMIYYYQITNAQQNKVTNIPDGTGMVIKLCKLVLTNSSLCVFVWFLQQHLPHTNQGSVTEVATSREQAGAETMQCNGRWNPFMKGPMDLHCESCQSAGLGRLAWIACWSETMIDISWLMQGSCFPSKISSHHYWPLWFFERLGLALTRITFWIILGHVCVNLNVHLTE